MQYLTTDEKAGRGHESAYSPFFHKGVAHGILQSGILPRLLYGGTDRQCHKGAELLCLSQPAVTRSIHRLEESLGCTLFTRVSRGVRLTVEGTALFSHVDSAFKSLSHGERELKRLAAFEAGTLTIGAAETPLYHFLLPKLGQFREMHPNVTLQVQGSSTHETIQMLRAEQADVVLAVSPLTDVEDLSVTELASFRDVFVAGPRFKSLAGRHLSYDEIFRFPIVAVESGTSARDNPDTWFAEQGITFLPNYSVRTSSTVIPFVEQGLAGRHSAIPVRTEPSGAGGLFRARYRTHPCPPDSVGASRRGPNLTAVHTHKQ